MCHGTKQTIQKVFTCPNDSVSQHERSQKKICKNLEPCLGEPLVYHCVRFKDEFAEVCAPRTMITGHCCAQYDAGIGRVVEDYGRHCHECPFQYESDNVLESAKCIETFKTNTSVVTEENKSTWKNKKEQDDDPIIAISIGISLLILNMMLLMVYCSKYAVKETRNTNYGLSIMFNVDSIYLLFVSARWSDLACSITNLNDVCGSLLF